MPNDRLRSAILSAGLKVEDVCARLGVDPKTVERWIASEARKPHRRTRRQVAELLDVDEVYLWPDLAEDVKTPPNTRSEVAHVFPTRSSVPYDTWTELINGVTSHMDVLVYSGAFLIEQYNLLPIVRQKTQQGAKYRFLIGDHTSAAVIQRGTEEGTPGGLEGRTQLMLRYLECISSLPGVEIRSHGTILYNSIYRFDDHMLVNGHAYGSVAGQNPVMHLRRVGGGIMWDHYVTSFERVWHGATPELI
ncbi:helix-turn-helix transcriptional regulator [Lentzea tibetensis]|uniref:Helix-turn-helix transcriptional regulator n=1 Tax=Lentzea tibetensis TaxID=2591470 RepID=A0A563EVS3_9PSEU|nr:helix-turn-helix transcriptional regulator [Lentzea tibetensis]TWP51254.1 helix-turn-helix transcriptional regulator [Lentzea tibetensis]